MSDDVSTDMLNKGNVSGTEGHEGDLLGAEHERETQRASKEHSTSEHEQQSSLKFERADLTQNPLLSKYKSADDLAEALLQMQRSGDLRPLADDATDEEKENHAAKIRTLIGVPETPEGYGTLGFAPSEVEGNQVFDWFRQAAHDQGLSPLQAAALAQGHEDFLREVLTHHKQQQEEHLKQFRSSEREKLVSHYGGKDGYEAAASRARLALTKLAEGAGASTEETESFKAIFGDHPLVIKLLSHIGKSFTESELVFGSTRSNGEPAEFNSEDYYNKMFGQTGTQR